MARAFPTSAGGRHALDGPGLLQPDPPPQPPRPQDRSRGRLPAQEEGCWPFRPSMARAGACPCDDWAGTIRAWEPFNLGFPHTCTVIHVGGLPRKSSNPPSENFRLVFPSCGKTGVVETSRDFLRGGVRRPRRPSCFPEGPWTRFGPATWRAGRSRLGRRRRRRSGCRA